MRLGRLVTASALCAVLAALPVSAAGATLESRTLEDVYGPSGDSFQAALGFRVFEGDWVITPARGYGVGVDDMRLTWREYKLVEDATDCAVGGACATIVIDAGRSYGSGAFHIRIVDASPYGAFAPFDRNDCDRNGSYLDAVDDTDCDDDGTPDVTLLVNSLAEPAGEPLVANRTGPGVYDAPLPYSFLANVAGVLLVQDAGPNDAEATVRYEDRWDGSASGDRCRNSANPAAQGFVMQGIEVEMVTGSVIVVSARLLDTNGDQDGFPDTNENFDLYLTVANKTSTAVSNVVVEISTTDPKIDCVPSSLAIIPSLDPRGGPNAIRETPTPFRLHVTSTSDRGGTVPAVSCTAGQCSNGAGACASAPTCQKTAFDDYAARIQVSIASDSFDVGSVPQFVDLDLDLNAAGPVQTTSTFVEGFEGGLGNFTFMNLDANVAGNSASDGARCQYNDPDYPNSNSYGDTECYLGFQAGQNPINDWHAHLTSAADGGRAYLGKNSLHYGVHLGGNGGDTVHLSQLDAVRTKAFVNLAARVCRDDTASDKRACNSPADCSAVGGGPCASASPVLSFKHQVSVPDSRSNSVSFGQIIDRAVVHAQVSGSIWEKVYPYENVYDYQGTDDFSNCLFDPTDDGNTEDDYFDPSDPARRYGPSSTCFPEFAFGFLGDTDEPFSPGKIGRASDGPGLPGSLGVGTWVESKFDLARFRGRSIRLRFVYTSIKVSDSETYWHLFMWNPTPADDGWYIDDVRVTQTLGASTPTTTSDIANNALLPSCPAAACSVITPALTLAPPSGNAPGMPIEMSATSSSADRCVNGTLLYRFFEDADSSGTFGAGDPVLRDFATASAFGVAPAATTRYGVSVRCSAGGTGNCNAADATATFTLGCGPPPPVFDPQLWWTQVLFRTRTQLVMPPMGEIVDVLRGSLDLLRGSGSFAVSGATCLADDLAATSFTDAAVPSSGSGFYYLMRGQVLCNDTRSYSTFSSRENAANPGKRDAELSACPP